MIRKNKNKTRKLTYRYKRKNYKKFEYMDNKSGATKKAYLTVLGRSTWALVNTYYAVLREKKYFPDRITIYSEEMYKEEINRAIEGITIINQRFGIQPEIESITVGNNDFIDSATKIKEKIENLKKCGYNIAVDITSGRKTLAAAAVLAASRKRGASSIYYLSIKTTRNVAKPYLMIPLTIQQIRDFVEDCRNLYS